MPTRTTLISTTGTHIEAASQIKLRHHSRRFCVKPHQKQIKGVGIPRGASSKRTPATGPNGGGGVDRDPTRASAELSRLDIDLAGAQTVNGIKK
jgi:hypothetical protein